MLDRLPKSRLYLLIDGSLPLARWTSYLRELLAAGIQIVQLRDKRLGDRELLQRAHPLRELTLEAGALFIVNDRPDLTVLANADGVHVGQDELSVHDARTIVGRDRLVGVSTHSIQQAAKAVRDGADYIGVGPTFASSTKSFEQLPGLELLRKVRVEISIPAFAIGGIDLNCLPTVLETGVSRIAVSSAIHDADDPVAVVRAMRRILDGKG